MANKKISDLTALGGNFSANDIFEVSKWTGSAYLSRYITGAEMSASISASNIGNSDLTIDSAGDRKLRMNGALATDRFVVRNSADTLDLFVVTGDGNVYSRGSGTSDTNTLFGKDTAGELGINNTVVGNLAGASLTVGDVDNTVMGYAAYNNGVGTNATVIGQRAAFNITAGSIVAIGSESASIESAGSQFVVIGYEAGRKMKSFGATHVGFQAGYNCEGVETTSFGYKAANTLGVTEAGTYLGAYAGTGMTTAKKNIVITNSNSALSSGCTTGQKNVLIGNVTGMSASDSNHVLIYDGDGKAAFSKDNNENIHLGEASALATTATNGFNYVRGGAGVPTGTPAATITGHVPMYADTTNNKLYIYSGGAWVALN